MTTNFTIERIETLVVRLPPRADFRWLSLSRPLGEFVLAKVEADGFTGWGEIVALRDWGDADGRRHGETPATVTAIVHDQLAPALTGRELNLGNLAATLDDVVVGNPYAKALLEIALHDLAGRRVGLPVHALLGGAARRRIPVAHMLGIMSNDEAMEEAHKAIADGVRALQVKGGQDAERDVSLIARLREEMPAGTWLRLDANGGYTSNLLPRRVLAALAAAGADLVEQPVLGLAALEAAHSGSDVPLMADEACWTPADALLLTARRSVDAISIYVGKAGGLARAREIASIARAAQFPHDVNGALELGIGNAANAHLAASSPAHLLPSVIPINAPAGQAITTTAGRYFEDDVVAEPFAYEDGALVVGDEPGLGVEVDLDKVDHYCVDRRASRPMHDQIGA
jgi:L-alanine-DL-glutamate epimerase-like enolase superfamily enzyme